MEKKTHFSIWYIIFAIIAMLVIQSVLFRSQIEPLPYSEFLKKIQDGKIKSVEISSQRILSIEKQLSEGEPLKIYSTVRVPDNDLIKLLKEHDVEFTGKVDNPWFRNMLSWIFPWLQPMG